MAVTIYIQGEGGRRAVEADEGATLLEALRVNDAHVDAPCGGGGTCKKCRVLASHGGTVEYVLACQTRVEEGMEVILESPKDMVVSVDGAFYAWPRSEADAACEGLGVAVDIGTTTVAMRLCDLATGEVLAATGRSNPQIAFGADVISRISACTEGHLEEQRNLIVNAMASMAADLLRQVKRKPADIVRMVIAGNTVMQSLACGVDPEPIGTAPYEPLTLFGNEEALKDAFFEALPPAYLAPCLAGYVGGDITAGMMATHLLERERPVLFLDLGTNGEMALGSAAGAVSCATAAGPVFEGANIQYGMPAYPGAISQVSIEDGVVTCKTVGDTEPVGICGTGLIDAIACLVREEVIEDTGAFADEDDIPEELAPLMMEGDFGRAFRLAGDVCVTQKDVRALQLAKSAIMSGILVMMEDLGIENDDIEELLIAGGFGEYLNLENAAAIGLFPAELLHCARSVGNSSLEGATQALVSQAAKEALEQVGSATRYIELSTTPAFNEYYVDNMYFE